MTARLLVAAAACLLAFVALGLWVTHHPLSRLDVESAALRGSNVTLAAVFTSSGYGTVLTGLGIASVVGALLLRTSVILPFAILISELVSQGLVELCKRLFARSRPDAWFFRHELGYSYPSGHATTAVVFFGAWLVVAWFSPLPLPVRLAAMAILAIWMIGIAWSRIALGAHYPTDVLGGVLLGTAWLCATIALAELRGAGAGLTTRHG